jgi:uncharacterized membrane protein
MTQVPGMGIAYAVSRDGSVIAGIDTTQPAVRAVRWTAASGAQPIGNFLVTGMSDSGDVVVGYSNQGAIRWTAQGGATLLPVPQGSTNIYAQAVSGDGSVIVGSINRVGGGGACIWLGAGVASYLDDYLRTLGLDLTGWSLTVASGVNDDGSVIVGQGFFNGESRGWAVRLRPGCATADFNHDGDAGTDADIEAFFACVAGNCCTTCYTADFNGDGDVGTDADIEAFFRVLAVGSC